MEKHIITIIIDTDVDTSTLLDMAIQAGEDIKATIESYGNDSEFHEEEVSVESEGVIAGGYKKQ